MLLSRQERDRSVSCRKVKKEKEKRDLEAIARTILLYLQSTRRSINEFAGIVGSPRIQQCPPATLRETRTEPSRKGKKESMGRKRSPRSLLSPVSRRDALSQAGRDLRRRGEVKVWKKRRRLDVGVEERVKQVREEWRFWKLIEEGRGGRKEEGRQAVSTRYFASRMLSTSLSPLPLAQDKDSISESTLKNIVS